MRETRGALSRAERRSLLLPLGRVGLENLLGRTLMALGLHAGRRARVDPDALLAPDSGFTRQASDAARELLSAPLLHHSHRTYAWGAALAAIQRVSFDRELLYGGALLHDTGLWVRLAPFPQ